MSRHSRSILRSATRIYPGHRGPSSTLPTPRLGTGQQLTDTQLRRIERCAEKVPYTCQRVAETAAVALGWAGIDVETYRCDVCDLWHVTHRRSA
jgi:hypothetical protein